MILLSLGKSIVFFSIFCSQKSNLYRFSYEFSYYFLLGNTIPGNAKAYCLKYLMSILKTGSWSVVVFNGTFIVGERNLFSGICSSTHFAPRILDPAISPGKFYPLFLLLERTIPENTRILLRILNIIF